MSTTRTRSASRSRGYLPDEHDGRDWPLGQLLMGIDREPRRGASLLSLRGPRLYQGAVSCCVGEALARSLHMSLRVQGGSEADTPVPSELFGYAAARRQKHVGMPIELRPALEDAGCFPRLALQAARAVGFVEQSVWPLDFARRNDDPPPDVLAQAFSQKGLSYARVAGEGRARLDNVETSLRMGCPVLFGIQVDQAFEDYVGSEPIAGIDTRGILGGHMLAALEVRADGTVLFDNWWGTDWGFDDGFGLLAGELFGSSLITDVYAIQAAPVFAASPGEP